MRPDLFEEVVSGDRQGTASAFGGRSLFRTLPLVPFYGPHEMRVLFNIEAPQDGLVATVTSQLKSTTIDKVLIRLIAIIERRWSN